MDGDGNTYRGIVCKDSTIKTYTYEKTADGNERNTFIKGISIDLMNGVRTNSVHLTGIANPGRHSCVIEE